MNRTTLGMLTLAVFAASALAAACVGDTPGTTPDAGGVDGGPDTISPDGAADAKLDVADAGPACDLQKPFGALAQVQGITIGQATRLAGASLDAYFMDNRDGGAGLYDLYTAHRTDVQSPFANTTNLTVLNSVQDDAFATVVGDGLTLILQSSRGGNFDLFSASRATAVVPFSSPTAIAALNTADEEAEPFVREDGQVLYFRRTVSANRDIYRATLGGGGFANPTAVSELNTTSAESAPVITPDELTIFFASNRTDGSAKGDNDVWMAKRTSTSNPFGAPVNVQELNSAGSEIPTFVSRDGCTIYVDRGNGGNAPLVAVRPK